MMVANGAIISDSIEEWLCFKDRCNRRFLLFESSRCWHCALLDQERRNLFSSLVFTGQTIVLRVQGQDLWSDVFSAWFRACFWSVSPSMQWLLVAEGSLRSEDQEHLHLLDQSTAMGACIYFHSWVNHCSNTNVKYYLVSPSDLWRPAAFLCLL